MCLWRQKQDLPIITEINLWDSFSICKKNNFVFFICSLRFSLISLVFPPCTLIHVMTHCILRTFTTLFLFREQRACLPYSLNSPNPSPVIYHLHGGIFRNHSHTHTHTHTHTQTLVIWQTCQFVSSWLLLVFVQTLCPGGNSLTWVSQKMQKC